MSVKNAPGEVDNKEIFDSPNIAAAEEETKEVEVDKEAEEQKKRETVDIDGVPIDEKDIKYKAADIRKKKKMKYFVHVTDKSKYEKAEAKKKAEAERAAEHLAAEEKREAEREEKEAKAEAVKKQVEEKKHIEEVSKYIDRQKSERERSAKKADKDVERFRKRRNLILIIVGAILVIAIIATVIAIVAANQKAEEEKRIRIDDESEAASSKAVMEDPYTQIKIKLDNDRDIHNYFNNYNYDDIDRVYDNFVAQITNEDDKGRLFIDKMQRLIRYSPDAYEEIAKAADRAYAYAPKNIEVLQNVAYAYSYAGQTGKAEAVRNAIKQLQEELSKQYAKDNQDGEQHAG